MTPVRIAYGHPLTTALLMAAHVTCAARVNAHADECSDGRLREIVETMRGGPLVIERRRRWPGLFDDEVVRIDEWAAALGAMRRRLDAGHYQRWQLGYLDDLDAMYVERAASSLHDDPMPDDDDVARRRYSARRYLYAAWRKAQDLSLAYDRVAWLVVRRAIEEAPSIEAMRAAEAQVTEAYARQMGVALRRGSSSRAPSRRAMIVRDPHEPADSAQEKRKT